MSMAQENQTTPTPLLTTRAIQAEADYWKKEFDRCKLLREQYEREWYMNMAFYAGRQYVVWQGTGITTLSTGVLSEPAVPRYRVRLVANKVKPAIRTELTKLTKEEPIFFCAPQTPEPEDVAAAKAAETISDWAMDHVKFKRKRRQITFWMLMCGVAFSKTYGVPAKDKQGIDFTDIDMDYVTAFHLYVPYLQVEDLEDQPYVIHARAVPTATVKKQWGVDVAPTMTTTGAALEQKFLSSIGIKNGIDTNNKDLCFIKEIWIKPCEKYPDGGLLVFAEDKLVYAYTAGDETPDLATQLTSESWTKTRYPLEHGQFPFDKFEHIPTGSFYADSVIKDLIPLQKEYNKTRSQIIESKNRMGKPQMTYTEGAINPRKVTSEPGLMIPVKPGFDAPRPVQQAPLQGWVIQELDRNLKDMDDATGQYEVSKGRTPPGVEAASAIAYLQEENDSKLHHTVASIEEATSSIGIKLLELIKQYWDVDRIQKVVSQNATFEAMQFKMSALENNTDIRVEAGSMAPKSRAAKQAFIVQLIQDGVIPPDKGLKYLDMNETNMLYEELQVDTKQAQRENLYMSKGAGLPPVDPLTGQPQIDPMTGQPLPGEFPTNEWDNDDIHIYEHGKFLKSQSFELLDEQFKPILVQHYLEHKNKVMMLNVNAAGNLGAEPGAGAGNPADGQQPAA